LDTQLTFLKKFYVADLQSSYVLKARNYFTIGTISELLTNSEIKCDKCAFALQFLFNKIKISTSFRNHHISKFIFRILTVSMIYLDEMKFTFGLFEN
jgi:hypothetical protein